MTTILERLNILESKVVELKSKDESNLNLLTEKINSLDTKISNSDTETTAFMQEWKDMLTWMRINIPYPPPR